MTCANRMGQAAKHVSDLALRVCGALLISLALMPIPSPGQARPPPGSILPPSPFARP